MERIFCNDCSMFLKESTKTCLTCDIDFKTTYKSKIYCSKKCSTKGFFDRNPDYVIPKTSRFNIDKETLNELYTIEKLPIKEICKIIGCKDQTVYTLLNKFSIPKRTRKDLTKK